MENTENKPVEGTENNDESKLTEEGTGNADDIAGEKVEEPIDESQIGVQEDAVKIAIIVPLLNRYLKKDHPAYHRTILKVCEDNMSTAITLALIQQYLAMIIQEEEVERWLEGSEFRREKEAIDHERDVTYVGMTGIVRANLKNINEILRKYANMVYDVLQNFKNVTKIDYEGETNAIKQIIFQLRSAEYMTASTALGLIEWLNKLEDLNNRFETYTDEQYQKLETKPTITFRQARKETDEALQAILTRAQGLLNLGIELNIRKFVNEFNLHTAHYNSLVREHYGRTHVKTDISDAIVDTIAEEDFTGKHITPIPVVSVRKMEPDGLITMVELVFSQDFTLTYKDNVGPGTATVIIQGTGQYKGKRIVTFNIKVEHIK
jgi:hypothetical protein